MLAGVARRHETVAGPADAAVHARLDRPGGLAGLLVRVADAGGNLVTVNHLREAVPLHVRETGVDLVLETRGEEHAAAIVAQLEAAGYEIERFDGSGRLEPHA